MIRLAFAGEMASGKDFWCDAIAREYDVEKVAIAAPFKAMWAAIRDLAGLPTDKLYARPFLQMMGNLGRAHHEDIWIDALLSKLRPEGSYVLSDVRFPNEARKLQAAGFTIVKIETNDTERRARLAARDGGHNASFEDDDTERFIRDIVPDVTVRGETEKTEETRAILRALVSPPTMAATDGRAFGAAWAA